MLHWMPTTKRCDWGAGVALGVSASSSLSPLLVNAWAPLHPAAQDDKPGGWQGRQGDSHSWCDNHSLIRKGLPAHMEGPEHLHPGTRSVPDAVGRHRMSMRLSMAGAAPHHRRWSDVNVAAGTAEQEFELVEYDLDSEDERWLQGLNIDQVSHMLGNCRGLHLSP